MNAHATNARRENVYNRSEKTLKNRVFWHFEKKTLKRSKRTLFYKSKIVTFNYFWDLSQAFGLLLVSKGLAFSSRLIFSSYTS